MTVGRCEIYPKISFGTRAYYTLYTANKLFTVINRAVLHEILLTVQTDRMMKTPGLKRKCLHFPP